MINKRRGVITNNSRSAGLLIWKVILSHSLIAALSLYIGCIYGPSFYSESNVDKIVNTTLTSSSTNTNDKNNTGLSTEKQRDFYSIAKSTKTDKVEAVVNFKLCLEKGTPCIYPDAERHECRPWGHYYHTLYQKWLGPSSTSTTEPFQFLEIGYFQGKGFDAYKEFLPQAEAHSIELYCSENAAKNKNYETEVANNRLHCGNAADINFLQEIWTSHMNRTDSPPLKVVVDDASHMAEHMVISMHYWFPRIEPRGIMVVEDIQPIGAANKFRTQFLPQIISDLHYCGGKTDGNVNDAEPCFPTLTPLLASIHCEMHICVFERNDQPSIPYDTQKSSPPDNALNAKKCKNLSQ